MRPGSPHYFKSVNPGVGLARRTARLARLQAALDVLSEVARLDPDHARITNAVGFSVSDVALGHRLSRMSAEALTSDPAAAEQALALASRYRRQVSPRLAFASGATDQPDLFE